MFHIDRMLLPIEPACAKELLFVALTGLDWLVHGTIVRSIRNTSAQKQTPSSYCTKKQQKKEVSLHRIVYAITTEETPCSLGFFFKNRGEEVA